MFCGSRLTKEIIMNINRNNHFYKQPFCLIFAALIILPTSCKAQKAQDSPSQNVQTSPTPVRENRGGCQPPTEVKDVGQPEETKFSDLTGAVLRKDVKTVKKLLSQNVDLEERGKDDRTALFYAMTPTVDDVNLNPPGQKRSPSRLRIEQLKQNREEQAQIEIAGELLAHGANPNQKDVDGETPAIRAAWFGYPAAHSIKLLTLLLEHQANINTPDIAGVTPLMEAVRRNEPELVKFLLDHRADPNLTDCAGKTALSIAQTNKNAVIIKLIEKAK